MMLLLASFYRHQARVPGMYSRCHLLQVISASGDQDITRNRGELAARFDEWPPDNQHAALAVAVLPWLAGTGIDEGQSTISDKADFVGGCQRQREPTGRSVCGQQHHHRLMLGAALLSGFRQPRRDRAVWRVTPDSAVTLPFSNQGIIRFCQVAGAQRVLMVGSGIQIKTKLQIKSSENFNRRLPAVFVLSKGVACILAHACPLAFRTTHKRLSNSRRTRACRSVPILVSEIRLYFCRGYLPVVIKIGRANV